MTPQTREWIAGACSAGGLVGMTVLQLPLAAALPACVALYAGLRLALPVTPPPPPEPTWSERFFHDAEAARARMDALLARLPPGPARDDVAAILHTSGRLLDLFRQKSDRMDVAALFPEHMAKLADLLARYVELHASLAADGNPEVLAQAGAVFAQARHNLQDLRERLLNMDLADLNANARVCEDLLKL